MKSLIAGVLLVAPVLANAYTWDQTIDFNPNPKLTSGSAYTFTYDLKTDGFNPSVDSISGYSLTIDLFNNDKGMIDAIYIDQPGISGDSLSVLQNWTYASLTTQGSYQGIASLNNDGLLNISIFSLGTFFLDSSELKATGTQGSASNTHAVPEPASVALLAAGLLGITVMRRNSNKTN